MKGMYQKLYLPHRRARLMDKSYYSLPKWLNHADSRIIFVDLGASLYASGPPWWRKWRFAPLVLGYLLPAQWQKSTFRPHSRLGGS